MSDRRTAVVHWASVDMLNIARLSRCPAHRCLSSLHTTSRTTATHDTRIGQIAWRGTTHRTIPSPKSFTTSLRQSAIFPFKLFDIGEGITEVEVLKWAVEPGQRVEEFDNLCEVQSDKSV